MGTKKSTTGGQHSFAQTPSVSIPRSSFNRSCAVKTTFDAGWLVPIFTDEVLPGDTLSLKMSHVARLATPLHPIMDNMFLDVFFFFVPNRLLWANWERFNGAQDNPGDSVDFTLPTITEDPVYEHQLSDYFGWPVGLAPPITGHSLYHRAYALIYNTWFRDENLVDSAEFSTDDGPDDPADYLIQRRGKRHDYFSSALPWPQKGDPVTIGIGGSAPVAFTTDQVDLDSTGTAIMFTDGTGDRGIQNLNDGQKTANWSGTGNNANHAFGTVTGLELDPLGITTGTADLSAATAVTINALRQAFQIQKLLERDARGGTRYTEILKSHFGISSPDQRLQRPEYLGGGTSIVRLAAVANTSPTTTPVARAQGELAAYGVSSAQQAHGFTKSFTEHGVIIGMVSARADLNYQQGLHRNFSRSTKLDFYWPSLSHLGEQAILNKEIYMQGTAEDDQVFGYQERYAEYRYKPSIITGQMRSASPVSLDVWHLAQDFDALPVLDKDFIEENPPVMRIVAVQTEPDFIFDGYFTYRSVRPMPTSGVPGLIDHF